MSLFCDTLCGVGVTWAASADRHGISHDDAMHAILNPQGLDTLEEGPGGTVTVFVGHPHPQTDQWIEVIARTVPPRTMVVFHVMELSDLYRYLLHEGEER